MNVCPLTTELNCTAQIFDILFKALTYRLYQDCSNFVISGEAWREEQGVERQDHRAQRQGPLPGGGSQNSQQDAHSAPYPAPTSRTR